MIDLGFGAYPFERIQHLPRLDHIRSRTPKEMPLGKENYYEEFVIFLEEAPWCCFLTCTVLLTCYYLG